MAYGGTASANSAVLGSKGLCSSSNLDLLIVSFRLHFGKLYSRIQLASRVHRTARQSRFHRCDPKGNSQSI
jgi:hypothetical protein